MTNPPTWPFPRPQEVIARYTAYRVTYPAGHRRQTGRTLLAARAALAALRRPGQRRARPSTTRAPRFYGMMQYLYVGYWIEEPFVQASLTERDALIYEDNDVELFVAGQDAYYEFEINALGTIYEVFFVWEEAYQRAGYHLRPEFRRDAAGVRPFNGVGFPNHPRGPRIGYWNLDFNGLRSAVHVDGTLNDQHATATAAGAWSWRCPGAGSRPWRRQTGARLPPRDGDIWRMDFSRFNQYKAAPPGQRFRRLGLEPARRLGFAHSRTLRPGPILNPAGRRMTTQQPHTRLSA